MGWAKPSPSISSSQSPGLGPSLVGLPGFSEIQSFGLRLSGLGFRGLGFRI